jgi:hypothetical protein
MAEGPSSKDAGNAGEAKDHASEEKGRTEQDNKCYEYNKQHIEYLGNNTLLTQPTQ